MSLKGIHTLFSGEATITAKIASGGTGKSGVYALRAPQGAPFPRVVLWKDRQDGYETLGGGLGASGTVLQVRCEATDYAAAESLSEAVDTFFRNYAGAAGDQTIAAVVKQDEEDELMYLDEEADRAASVRILTYLVQWR